MSKNSDEKSEENDNNKSLYNLALCYDIGKGTEKNLDKAFEIYTNLVNSGFNNSLYNLALCYLYGKGTEINLEKAYELFIKSIKSNTQNSGMSQCSVGECYENGYGVETHIDKAIEYYTKSTETGYPRAYFKLGECYYKGKGVELNMNKAFILFKISADKNYNIGQYCLGLCYNLGEGTEQNLEKAFVLFKKSAENNYDHAQYNLGNLYKCGILTKQNLEGAFKWFKIAGENGNKEAQQNVIDCYTFGKGTKQNLEEAYKWYIKHTHNISNSKLVKLFSIEEFKNKIQIIHENNNKILLAKYTDKLNNLVETYKDDKSLMYKNKKYIKYNYNIGILYYRLKQLENSFNYLEEAAYLKYSLAQKALSCFYKKEKDFLYNEKDISYDAINEFVSTWYYLSKGIVNID